MDPHAIVAFFPSDHHFADDRAFVEHIDLAFKEADARRERVILLGIEADAPEESYGWIEPGAAIADSSGDVFEVSRFWEKPTPTVAGRLFRRGCLWNSFVMVGAVEAFINMTQRAVPELVAAFDAMWIRTTPGMEADALRDLYDKVPASNFSNDVLAASSSGLSVLRARGLGWSDLGEPQRVFSALGPRDDAHRWEQWMGAGLAVSA